MTVLIGGGGGGGGGGRAGIFIFVIIAFLAVICQASKSHAPPVKVELEAPWPAPPLLLEALEAAESERRGSLFALIDELFGVDAKADLINTNDQKTLSAVLRALDNKALLTEPGERATFHSSLVLHTEAPRIAAAWQLYNTSDLHERVEKHQRDTDEDCTSWVDFEGKVLCSQADLQDTLTKAPGIGVKNLASLLPRDHIWGADKTAKPIAVLYADYRSANFFGLHRILSQHTDSIRYVLRWKPIETQRSFLLSGYGAYLDLKKVDYLVIDDRKLVDSVKDDTGVIDDQNTQELGQQEALNDRQWLDSHLKLSEESRTASLSSLTEDEIRLLGSKAAYAVLTSDEPVRALMQLSQNFPSHAVALARDAQTPSKTFMLEVEQMQTAMVEAGGEDIWLNGKNVNLKEFHTLGLHSILRDERRLMNSLASVGMNNTASYAMLTSPNVSKAFGTPSDNAQPPTFDASDRIERSQISNATGAITYWNDLEAKGDPRYASWPSELRSLLRPLYPGSFPVISRNIFNVIIAMDPAKLETVRLLSDNVQMATTKIGLRWGFVPLIPDEDDGDNTSTRMAQLIWLSVKQLDTTTTSKWLRRVAAANKRNEHIDVDLAGRELDKLLYTTPTERDTLLSEADFSQQAAMSRAWIKRLRPDENGLGGIFVNGQHMPYHPQLFQTMHQLVAMQLQTIAPMIYYEQLDEENTDFSTFFYDLPGTYSARSDLLFPPTGGRIGMKAVDLSHLQHLIPDHLASQGPEPVSIWAVFATDSKEGAVLVADLESVTKQRGMTLGTIDSSALAIDMPADHVGILVNGKLIHGFEPSQISPAEYDAVIEQELQKSRLLQTFLDSPDAKDAILASSIVNAAFFVDSSKEGFFSSTSTERSSTVDQLPLKEATFTVGDPQKAALRFSLLVNPLGKNVQKWSGVISMLSQQADVSLRVILNPNTNLSELPLRRYYRSSDLHQVRFDNDGQVSQPSLTFYDMPQEAVLTMGLDAPPAWLTMPSEAIYDLDNIRLRDAVTPSVHAVYELRYVLIEGHVRDIVSRVTPRGLELVLETFDGKETLDTIVMANLAYFQFRARPGYYRLRIRQGRSAELYEMESVGNEGWDSPPVNVTGNVILLDTFAGATLFPRMSKKKGKEKEMLVVEDGTGNNPSRSPVSSDSVIGVAAGDAVSGVWGKVQAAIRSSSQTLLSSAPKLHTPSSEPVHTDINVFTVASGHLYERMTYIMILSTLKHTKRTVKFWFIENFLSPSFKRFIPHLAHEYGFKYELVTYAWPHWLRPQDEKQRSIWGMKVLFLDVLFPLSLSNVIFVDADQIVRADLMELVEMDLQGAPYGFAPMGNDSHDMDNFRFWETGYWEKFLRGKPYPISALYVVDLNRFRLVAAGDKLRGHYQALSADPNSLSNLDQDLVASMIHNVPIFSLPREWLWCETWCSTDWYDKAKSIDLCSNPKTHEPKLDRARRQIPEWTPLDEEVGRLARRLEEEGRLGTNVVASSKTVVSRVDEKGKDASHREVQSHDEL